MTRKKFITLAAVFSALLIAVPFVCNEKLTETHYTVKTDKVSSPVKIAFLSDIHNTLYGKGMSELISSVDRYAPDIVIFGGDLFNRSWEEYNSRHLVKSLSAKYPCFYALGNHEFKYGAQNDIRKGVPELGVKLLTLEDNFSDITVNGNDLRIIGMDSFYFDDQYKRCCDAVSDDRFDLLIYHYPEDFPELSDKGFDLILSGHAHGGQIRIPLILPDGFFSPGEGFFPHYTCGEYFENGSEMIVSRGLQRCIYDFIIPRVFNRPEAVYITLEP